MLALRSLVGAVALLVGAAASACLAPSAAHAAPVCAGVTVVVDHGALGGGVAQDCVAGGGGEKAAQLFAAAGHTLTRVQSQPGAVCLVDGLPSGQPCAQMPSASAYWGLFWSNGTSGSWTYASLGVDSLAVPTGGAVAFVWQSSSSRTVPGVAAPVTSTASTPTAPAGPVGPTKKSATPHKPKTGKKASAPKPTPRATSAAASPTPGSSPTASPTASPSAPASASPSLAPTSVAPSASPSATPSPSVSPSTTAVTAQGTAGDGGGLPGWVAPVVVVVILAAGGGIAVGRRRLR